MARLALIAALSSMTVLVSGCMVGPNYTRPPVAQPLQFKSGATATSGPPVQADWWRLYGDADLDQLIATAQASNQTLQQAVARVDQARALALVAGSFLYPTITADPHYSITASTDARSGWPGSMSAVVLTSSK